MVRYQIVASGSKGNAAVLEDCVMIDCGVPFSTLKNVYKDLRLVLLTHIHSDHFKKTTIKALAAHRPTLRFACGPWLAGPLVEAGVSKSSIDILTPKLMYPYPGVNVIPVQLTHNVPCYGYKLHFPAGKVFYATDTGNLNGISAYHYDLYMVEANYEDKEIRERIARKKAEGIFPYEQRVLQNHLSKQQCDSFIYANIGSGGQYVYMHQHEGGSEECL